MNEKPTRPSRRLRSTLDRVLVHDIKNMGFRLQLLLSNLEENYGNPEFKRSVEELLRSTVDRIDGIVDRFSTGDEPVLIKVALDLNGIVREVAEGETRRGLRVPPATPGKRTLSLALGAIPEIWGDPYYLTDALRSLIENALEAVPPEGRVLVRTYRDESARRPRVVIEIIDNGTGMSPEFVRDRLFKPSDDEAGRRRPRSGDREPARPAPRREVQRHDAGGGRHRGAGELSGRRRVLGQPAARRAAAVSAGVRLKPVPGTLGSVVIVEDDPILLDQLTWSLKGHFEIASATDAERARPLCETDPDLYLFDLRLPPSGEIEEGLNLLKSVRQRNPDATVVMMSGEKDRQAILRSIELGAFDFFRKPVDPAELLVILKRALERRRLVAENRELRERSRGEPETFDRLVGASKGMRRLFREIEKVAPSDATVLLVGESGTGKELVAHSIHARSNRRERLFVAVNASALPESLAESELFGHEKGSFTGAVASRPGRFELAHGGTLFLDEVGTLSAPIQSKLLRVLETREVERVGGRRSISVDFRLISATNEDLEGKVAAGTFREDLFYRINAVPIRIPPLRDRPDDIPLLAEHFVSRFSARHGRGARRLSAEVLERFREHPWKGNVRELEHVVENLILFSEGDEIGVEDLPRVLRASAAATPTAGPHFAEAVEEFERRLLSDAIRDAGGVKAEAARRLGLDGNQIKYLCRKYGL